MATLGNLTTQGTYWSSDRNTSINLNTVSNNSTDFATMNSKFANGGRPEWAPLVQNLELKLYKQSIRLIELENKMTKEECVNLKTMLESNDTPSVILAKEIIDNLETYHNEYSI
jgi:hypothetical protein